MMKCFQAWWSWRTKQGKRKVKKQDSGLRRQSAQSRLSQRSTSDATRALADWNERNGFCACCGRPMRTVDGERKRKCCGPKEHTVYPRVDPVVCMLVESPDQNRALLVRARNSKFPAGMVTCPTGFVEQAESAEQACIREVLEETGVNIDPDTVELVHTQAWPQGWAGTCELMIGCTARAVHDALKPNLREMAEVEWVHRNEILARIAEAGHDDPSGSSEIGRDFELPFQDTIGYRLLIEWCGPSKVEE
ncbi:hypothetical protein WJX79_000969 [Trebouxia sp. C0005]